MATNKMYLALHCLHTHLEFLNWRFTVVAIILCIRYIYIYIYIVVGLRFCLRNDAYERQSIPFFLVLNLYSWGSKRYQLLKSNIYKRRYAWKKINMIFIYKFIILLSAFRIKLLKNKRKHKKKRRKWKNGH